MKKRILRYLSVGNGIARIARLCRRDEATIRYHLGGLERDGLVVKKDWIWFVTDAGKAFLTSAGYGGEAIGNVPPPPGVSCGTVDINHKNSSRKVGSLGYVSCGKDLYKLSPPSVSCGKKRVFHDRAHAIKIITKVRESPPGDQWLTDWKPLEKVKNGPFYLHKFGELSTMYTKKSIVFSLPPLRFSSAAEALAEAGKIADALIQKYEREIPGLKLGDREIKAVVIQQHHAQPGEPFAAWCVKHGISFRDDMIEIDSSAGPELEFINPQKSHEHFDRYIEKVRDMAENDSPKISDIWAVLGVLSVESMNSAKVLGNVVALLAALAPKPEEIKEAEKDKGGPPEYIG